MAYEVTAKCQTCDAKEVVGAEGEIPKGWLLVLEHNNGRGFVCGRCWGRLRELFGEGSAEDPVRKAIDLTLENNRLSDEKVKLARELQDAHSDIEALESHHDKDEEQLARFAATVQSNVKAIRVLELANKNIKDELRRERLRCAALRGKLAGMVPAKPVKKSTKKRK